MSYILGVETSCDDTSVALVKSNAFVSCVLTANQNFKPYGGVVPELASRNHAGLLMPLIDKLLKTASINWEDISSLAVTNRPGLIGSLTVGLVTVKTLALALNKPYIAVNHIEGHILSAFLWDKKNLKPEGLKFPFLALIVSGGHSHLFSAEDFGQYNLIGKTCDDSAGEVLDKFARLIGLSYPSGALVDKMSQTGVKGSYHFPKPVLKKGGLDFSFSGLKTSAVRLVQKIKPLENKKLLPDLCADFQEAVVDQIMDKLNQAVDQESFKRVVIAGGVSANLRLRVRAKTWSKQKNVRLFLPPLQYCTDNAAMIAYAGSQRILQGLKSTTDTVCSPCSFPEDFNCGHKNP